MYSIRLCRPKIGRSSQLLASSSKDCLSAGRELRIMQILVTGASGTLGSHLIPELLGNGHQVIAWSATRAGHRAGIPLQSVDLTDTPGARRALEEANPDLIVHAAAISSAAEVARDPGRGWNVNKGGTEVLSAWARQSGRSILLTSTDLVFDGSRTWYREDDQAAPILEYGRTKQAAETLTLANPHALVVRICLLYGPTRTSRLAYFDQAMADLRSGKPRTFFEDEFRTPLDYVSAASILVRLVGSGVTGIVHVGGPERVSRFELMQRAARVLGADPSLVRANRRADAPGPEPRPADVSLDTTRMRSLLPNLVLPSIEDALSPWRP
jgi:dTDP-4-dehydrorhamnose reductase